MDKRNGGRVLFRRGPPTGARRQRGTDPEAAEQEVSRLILLMQTLAYMSSAGLRCLVFAHQKMPAGTEIVLVGTQPEVAETIRLTGFDRSVVMQESPL